MISWYFRGIIFLLWIFMLTSPSYNAQNNQQERIIQAIQAQDLERATALITIQGSEGPIAAEIWANLAVLYSYRDEAGLAILYTKRAIRMQPRQSRFDDLLAIVTNNVETGIAPDLRTYALKIFSLGEWGLLALLSWSAGWLITGIFFAVKTRRLLWRAIFIIAWGAIIALNGIYVLCHVLEISSPLGIVIEDTRLYSGPGNSFLEIGIAHEATEVRILEEREGWYRVDNAGNTEGGWISQSFVGLINDQSVYKKTP